MTVEFHPLPYASDALAPHMSAETFEFHHGRHYKTYVDNTNNLIKDTPLATQGLVDIIKAAAASGNKKLFNNAAQTWNHEFFFAGMKPGGGGEPTGVLADWIKRDFESFEAFKTAFAAEATGHFASGWAWLVVENGRLKITSHHDAETPVTQAGVTPLLTLDVWEHAYYLDHRNARPKFIEAFFGHLVNWDEVAKRLAPIAG